MRKGTEFSNSIIIDEVDVSGCALLCSQNRCKACIEHKQLRPKDNLIPVYCEGNDCYYKQLQKQLKRNEDLVYIIEKGQDKVTELKKEIEKLKDKIIFEYHGVL